MGSANSIRLYEDLIFRKNLERCLLRSDGTGFWYLNIFTKSNGSLNVATKWLQTKLKNTAKCLAKKRDFASSLFICTWSDVFMRHSLNNLNQAFGDMWPSENMQSTSTAENKLETFFVVSSLSIDRRSLFISSLTASSNVVVSVTIISQEFVAFGNMDSRPFSSQELSWQTTDLKSAKSAAKKQKTSANGHSRWE